jgi:hypothetical protein
MYTWPELRDARFVCTPNSKLLPVAIGGSEPSPNTEAGKDSAWGKQKHHGQLSSSGHSVMAEEEAQPILKRPSGRSQLCREGVGICCFTLRHLETGLKLGGSAWFCTRLSQNTHLHWELLQLSKESSFFWKSHNTCSQIQFWETKWLISRVVRITYSLENVLHCFRSSGNRFLLIEVKGLRSRVLFHKKYVGSISKAKRFGIEVSDVGGTSKGGSPSPEMHT